MDNKWLTSVPKSPVFRRACPSRRAFVENRPSNARLFVILPVFLWFSAHSERYWAIWQTGQQRSEPALNHKRTTKSQKLEFRSSLRPSNARIFAKKAPVFLQKWARLKNWVHCTNPVLEINCGPPTNFFWSGRSPQKARKSRQIEPCTKSAYFVFCNLRGQNNYFGGTNGIWGDRTMDLAGQKSVWVSPISISWFI